MSLACAYVVVLVGIVSRDGQRKAFVGADDQEEGGGGQTHHWIWGRLIAHL